VAIALVSVLALGVVSFEAIRGFTHGERTTQSLYTETITPAQLLSDVDSNVAAVRMSAVAYLILHESDPSAARAKAADLSNRVLPAADNAFRDLTQSYSGRGELNLAGALADIAESWQHLRATWNLWTVNPPTPSDGLLKIDELYQDLHARVRAVASRIAESGASEYRASLAPYSSARVTVWTSAGVFLALIVAAVVWLQRSVVFRVRRYERFAARVAKGEANIGIDIQGRDELAQLAARLDEMARRHDNERDYDDSQNAYTDSMQLTENETEAHEILRRHLERSIPESSVVVLNKNNSQDRLEPVTELPEGSPLRRTLTGAVPRSCIAIRQASTYEAAEDEDRLLACDVCGDCPGNATCTPLLVGGEVIGSVLVNHAEPLQSEGHRRIRDSVVQSAPVMANLRTLAVAENRASTDALTGLSNRRSIDVELLRAVAHSATAGEPLSVLMFDLDHFKRINDTYGHGSGDEVLAAVGAAVRTTIREHDFGGRYGGEEFLVMLPGCTLDGAVVFADRLRRVIGDIHIPSVDRKISASFGVASVPEHAIDADALLRAADRALYAAKKNGRDRVEIAVASEAEALAAEATAERWQDGDAPASLAAAIDMETPDTAAELFAEHQDDAGLFDGAAGRGDLDRI
jgi:diguanylate cyclase (GGDEF)-like protein